MSPDYYFVLPPLATGLSADITVPRVDIPLINPTEIIDTIPYYANIRDTYAGIQYNPNNGTFVFNGYFRPPLTGSYSICVEVNNIDNFYLGSDKAFACGATTPVPGADPTLVVPGSSAEAYCGLQYLEAGFFYPLRSVYGMNGLPSYLFTNITFPGATAHDASALTGTLYPQSCVSPLPAPLTRRANVATDLVR